MKKVILDTNIYGELSIDQDLLNIKVQFKECKDIIIYGADIIRKELRATPKRIRTRKMNLRILLLSLYDDITKDHNLRLNNEAKEIASNYYAVYRKVGGSKAKDDVIIDFEIVAIATLNCMDIVVSEDERSMMTENARKAYQLVNDILKKKTPVFIKYAELKRILRGCELNKFPDSHNKLRVILSFLNLFPYIFFSFHNAL